ncbi:MAG: hypothetical protein E7559_09260 [Ruminococcaceae bacterium]|nr:hypothetical protein [Oscillospiraceae bacterium]
MKPGKLYGVAAVLIVLAAMTALLSGCSSVDMLMSGSPTEDVLGALQEDLFGCGEQYYNTLEMALPRHSGYAMVEDKYAYDSLTEQDQREAYRMIEENVWQVTSEAGGAYGRYALRRIDLPDSLTSGEILMVKEAVLADHPEVFWVNNNYSLGYNFHDGNYMSLYTNYSYGELTQRIGALEDNVALALREIPGGLNEYDRELIIHDIIVRDVQYDVEAAEQEGESLVEPSSSYGALVNKMALCSGYSHAAKLLLNRVGISCTTIKGMSMGTAHMWNLVNIDDNWYHLDVTWNDPITYSEEPLRYYDYFNLNDENIGFDHEFAEHYNTLTEEMIANQDETEGYFFNFTLPECTSMKHNYYELNAVPVETLSDESAEMIERLITAMSQTKETSMLINFPKGMDYKVVEAWLDDALYNGIRNANRKAAAGIKGCTRINRSADDPSWCNVYSITLDYGQLQ